MVAAIEQRYFNIDHRISGECPVLRRLFDPLLNSGNVLTRNRAALDSIDEFKPNARLLRLEGDPDIAILAPAAGLPHKPALLLNFFPHRFFVRDLRLTYVGTDIKFPQQAVDNNLEMQFAHARDDGLPGFFVGANLE